MPRANVIREVRTRKKRKLFGRPGRILAVLLAENPHHREFGCEVFFEKISHLYVAPARIDVRLAQGCHLAVVKMADRKREGIKIIFVGAVTIIFLLGRAQNPVDMRDDDINEIGAADVGVYKKLF